MRIEILTHTTMVPKAHAVALGGPTVNVSGCCWVFYILQGNTDSWHLLVSA